ncbi:MAG: substrate-binding domain-containing protein [Treponema sp.]|jgi:ribose transport system substrate-binding protein|nr:substrate-binding domain-containing protein [Treponema sp.]
MKKAVSAALIMLAACCTVFASGKADVGFTLSTLNNPFFVSMKDGAESKAKALGVNLSITDASDDPAKQVKDIEDLVNKGIKVLIVNPVDSAAVAPTIKDVIARGIKVIAVDRYVDGVTVDTYIGTDNVLAANKAGKSFVQIVGPNAVIAVLEGVPAASSNIDRMEGYRQALTAAGLKAAVTQTANYNRAEALTVTENILQSNPNITAILAMNDEMALGAIEAVRAKAKIPGKDILIAGFDAGDDARAAVKAGEMIYTVEQKTVLMGETAVETAKKYINGAQVPANIPIDVEIITK